MNDSIGHKIRKARKEYDCQWCGEKINKGKEYESWAWVDGGDISTVRVHQECAEAWGNAPLQLREEYTPYEQGRGCSCAYPEECESEACKDRIQKYKQEIDSESHRSESEDDDEK